MAELARLRRQQRVADYCLAAAEAGRTGRQVLEELSLLEKARRELVRNPEAAVLEGVPNARTP
ncbi:MAG TPA: hypothetical protein VHO25_12605 [Polyangiaceae bacterium]|nr:hypothetical protein [Polyangiaceae bacterium]